VHAREPNAPQGNPLLPLRTVQFSGGRLPQRIFEPRYTAMVTSLREKSWPGVVLIREGDEARLSKNAVQLEIFSVGTHARSSTSIRSPTACSASSRAVADRSSGSSIPTKRMTIC
jgi:Lon protease-like protein